MRLNKFMLATLLLASAGAQAVTVKMQDLTSGAEVGLVTLTDNHYGVVFTPALSGLPAGLHGFHVHANGSCDSSVKDGQKVLGGAAGGHYDPQQTGRHGAPWQDNAHRGDLPPLYVDNAGSADQPVLSPRLTLKELSGKALMIHAGGDNHADHPAPLGGGGARMVCGVIP
ncbi:superoxide dismutase [Aeromonas cavernicola]|uniref:Superoxide dismutase [Cu-Zn] n=2 Tax=Aeromonas cavernicola TaxID=1006623 RepID=A0A2H9U9K0_9GAMM|nr:superoxide dismutase [Aeromonas cavernicola]